MNAFLNKFSWHKGVQMTCMIALGLLFIFAGLSKLQDLSEFTKDINDYRMLPQDWAPYLAAWLPWLETFTGAAILFRPFRLTGIWLSCLLLAMFTFAVATALVRGVDISCGCFGKAFEAYAGSASIVLLRDICLLVASFGLLRLIWKNELADSSLE